MKLYSAFLSLITIAFAVPVMAQKTVQISDTTVGKRITVFAQNTADTIVNIFFKIEAKGYRKSAERPVIVDLPPKRKIKVATLVKVNPEAADYRYVLVVNDTKADDIHVTKDRDYIADITPLLKDRIVIFGHPNCDRCQVLIQRLTARKIPHKYFNIDQDALLYDQFSSFLDKIGQQSDTLRLPVVWNKNYLMNQDLPAAMLLQILSTAD